MPLRSDRLAPSGAFFRLQLPFVWLALLMLGCPITSPASTAVPGAANAYAELSLDETWLRLLHYQGGVLGGASNWK